MTDKRRHRGPHPKDAEFFSAENVLPLQEAVDHLSWLMQRGYAMDSSLKLVGDRFHLFERQRIAVRRATCSDTQKRQREHRRRELSGVQTIWIDGFNLITTIEAALAGGVILDCRDAQMRDMASMHGTYRRVDETRPALLLIGEFLNKHVQTVHWLLDQPVSNSGRLAAMMRGVAEEHAWNWTVETVRDPDVDLVQPKVETVVSADSMILDHCRSWCHVARHIVKSIDGAWIIPMADHSASQ